MSLVAGRGPLSNEPDGWFSPRLPAEVVYVEPHPRRVQAVRGGRMVIDTERVLLVHRRNHPLSYAFPRRRGGRPAQRPRCRGARIRPRAMGRGRHLDLKRDARWCTTRPTRITASTAGRPPGGCASRWPAPRWWTPTDTVIVFETALDPRLYVDPAHVRTELLRQSNTSTYCNYKGWATYWSAADVEDVAWSYLDPPPESSPIKGFISFDASRATVIAELPGQDLGGE